MAKKAKATGQKSVIEQLSEYRPPWEDPVEEKKDADPNAGLVERLAKLEAENLEFKRQQAYQGFSQAPASTQTEVKKKESFEIDLKGLPDPVSHPTEYTAELTKRQNAAFEKRLEADRAEQAAKAEQASLAQRVWDGFKAAQPDWSKHELLVQAAAGKISTDMVGRGVDMVKLLKQQPDLFYGEVTSLLEKQYPQLKVEKEEGEGDGEEANRTAGVFGGTPGKQSGATGEQSTPDDNDNFLRSIAEMRYKAGVR